MTSSPGWMGGGVETVEGLTGAQGLKNVSMAWSGLFDPAPPAPFACLTCRVVKVQFGPVRGISPNPEPDCWFRF